MIADDIYDRFVTDNVMEDVVPRNRTILSALKRMLRHSNTLSLYKEFYKHNGIADMLVMSPKKKLEWNDVYPFLYLYAAFEGLQQSRMIKHLVVDEMQDYTPIQYAVLNRLFLCQKTILGDFGQFINPNHLHTLEDLRQLYQGAEFAALTKSYRSTYEIISFARRIKVIGTIDAIERHGEEPALIPCADQTEQLQRIKSEIDAFSKSGYASLGIVAKTNGDAKRLYEQLADEYDVHLLSSDSARFENGVTIASIKMSKGLEFDSVLIPDADSEHYDSEYDRSLLYIACTRAMHKLTVTYVGDAAEALND
jgi:DNA helicase-2/ATP-dependent DNA helicase PcrA